MSKTSGRPHRPLTLAPGALRPARLDDFFVAFARVALRVLVLFFAAMCHLLWSVELGCFSIHLERCRDLQASRMPLTGMTHRRGPGGRPQRDAAWPGPRGATREPGA